MTSALHSRHYAQETGMCSVTWVPCPGWLEISTLPPRTEPMLFGFAFAGHADRQPEEASIT